MQEQNKILCAAAPLRENISRHGTRMQRRLIYTTMQDKIKPFAPLRRRVKTISRQGAKSQRRKLCTTIQEQNKILCAAAPSRENNLSPRHKAPC